MAFFRCHRHPLLREHKLMIRGVVLIIIFAGLLALGGLGGVLQSLIKAIRVIKRGTLTWELWRTMPVDIYMKLYLFNITNPLEFQNGAKAKLVEMGPYVFLEDFEKVDLFENATDNTIKFRMLKWSYFQPHMSAGSVDDKVTFVNAVFVVAAAVVRENLEEDFFRMQFDEFLAGRGERLTRTERVGDLLFDGINIRTYTDFLDNPLVKEAAADLGFEGLPPNIANGTFALFKGTNGTDDGWLVVHSGIDNTDLAGDVVSHNGKTRMTAWRGDECNAIRGSDATFFPPRISKTSPIYFFVTLVCRSVGLDFHSERVFKGVDTWRFSVSNMFKAPKSYPPNWCYCPRLKNETGTCDTDGIASLAPCFGGAPLFVSQPHFYGAEQWVRNAVDGMKPNFDKHETVVYFHPFFGVPLGGWGRFQVAIELIPYEEMPSFSDAQHAYIPVAWIELGLEIEEWHGRCIQALDWLRKSFTAISYIFITLGVVTLGYGLVIIKSQNKALQMVSEAGMIPPKLWAVKVESTNVVPFEVPSATATTTMKGNSLQRAKDALKSLRLTK